MARQPRCAVCKQRVALLECPLSAVDALDLSGKLPAYLQGGRNSSLGERTGERKGITPIWALLPGMWSILA